MLRVALPPVRRVIGRVAARAAKARPRAPPCPGRRRDRPPSPSTDPATARHSGGRARRDRAVPPWGRIIEGFTTETQRARRTGLSSPRPLRLSGGHTPTLTLPPRGGGNGRGASRRDAGVRDSGNCTTETQRTRRTTLL